MKTNLSRSLSILLTLLLAACGPLAPTPTVTPSATSVPSRTPTLPPIETPSPTPTPAPQQPPACTFPLAQTTMEESKPEEYTFSEPKVILTAIQGNYYDIVEWLPDNQQVLMTQELYDISKSEGDKILRQSIEIYNPTTGASQVYAIRDYIDEPPSWQPELNAVVYSAMNILGIDENTHQYKFTRQVWVSHGDSQTAQILADNLSQFPLAIKPGGSAMLYLSDKKISRWNASLEAISSGSFNPAEWDYGKGPRDQTPVSYEMAWQPGTSLIFLHSEGGMQLGGGYTFILNADTGQICELNLGGWAVRAHWSSDGRYLAIIKAAISSKPVDVTDMAILDSVTGKLYVTTITPHEIGGKHYVEDLVWAPDNHHLLVLENISAQRASSDETTYHELYLVDFLSDQSIRLFSEYKSFFADGAPKNNFAWSPDGSKLLIRCPTKVIDRVCLISVQRTTPP